MGNNKILEKVFLKKDGWTVTNKSITKIEDDGLRWWTDVTRVWAAKDIESVKEVVSHGFSKKRGLVIIGLFLSFWFLGSSLRPETLFGMSDTYSRWFMLLSVVGFWTTIYQYMIKEARFLSIKLKNGEEIVTYTPTTSLVAVENAWEQAITGGIDNGIYDITLSAGSIEVTKETFSIRSEEEPEYVSEPFSSAYAPTWKTFNISDVINIAETKMRKDLFNEYTMGALSVVVVFTFLFFKIFGESGNAALGFFAILMFLLFVPLKRMAEIGEKEITLELKDGESIKVNGCYGWDGISKVKTAINESMTMVG